jgi:hypothetical protein
MIRPPLPSERAGGDCNAVLIISALKQQVMETVEQAQVILESGDNGNA